MEPYLIPGDVFFTQGTSWFSRAIRFFTRLPGEPPTLVNHVGVIVSSGYAPWEVEALSRVRRRQLRVAYGGKRMNVAIYRMDMSRTSQEKIMRKADSYVGRKYGYGKIVAHFLDWCIGGQYFFRRLAQMDNYPICSWVVAYAYQEAGFSFGLDPSSASPDDIWDYVTNHEDWHCVKELGPLR